MKVSLTVVTHFPFVPSVVADAQEVIPGLDAPALVFTRVWTAPEKHKATDINQQLAGYSSKLRMAQKVNILFSELCNKAIFAQELF